ncbi:7-cyano-7-deazaguanine synthase QueC [Geodermatophilus sp. FMUSA9-8]|uniref:7-cyano-7-deazaguanine synthase QueC n=1 Tax=Geodermatophilus sp. FMUSA9-8 TaxID=3120155 RepID=UPI003008E1AE
MSKPAVVLLSGGLDSTTVLAIARDRGFEPFALSFDYGQKHEVELRSARTVGAAMGVRQHQVLHVGLGDIGGSSLTDDALEVPVGRTHEDIGEGIPSTYVPARNTVFLACALGYAEVLGAEDIFIGVNALDYSGYPDCRPEFIEAFERLANLATAAAVEGRQRISVHAPLMAMTKADIVTEGTRLGVDYSMTVSCYRADERGSCGECDSCTLRLRGFEEAGLVDPTPYWPR